MRAVDGFDRAIKGPIDTAERVMRFPGGPIEAQRHALDAGSLDLGKIRPHQ